MEMSNDKADIELELKLKGIHIDEITNILIKLNDKKYDINKSLINIKNEIRLFKDKKDYKDC